MAEYVSDLQCCGLCVRLARFFGTSPQVWMGLQTQYELDTAADAAGREIQKRVKPFKAA